MLVLIELFVIVWLCSNLGVHSSHSDRMSIFGDYARSELYRQRRQTNCNGSDIFTCKSGQCISNFHICDGTPHCIDKSDETSATCSTISCTGFTFQCAYGACISLKGLCNGISDCVDNSDENTEMCSYTNESKLLPVTPATSEARTLRTKEKKPSSVIAKSCVLPAQIKNGDWKIFSNPEKVDYRPGDQVELGLILQFKCNNGFKIDSSSNFSFCNDGSWNPSVPGCIQTCPSLASTHITRVTCTYKGREINCSEAVSHTTARYTCAPFYDLSSSNNILNCLDGTWDSPGPICEPICGQKIAVPKGLLASANMNRGSNPWSIGLYRERDESFTHICGGTLISSRLIVTAAHCVTDLQGKIKPADIYRVAAGKYYRDYNDVKDTNAEFSQIQKIYVHNRYKGSILDFEADIAVLVTKGAFNTSKFIQRACVDWDRNSDFENHLLATKGTVTGWGYTAQTNSPSPVLKEVSVPFVDFSQCYNALPANFVRYLKNDKMCAGGDEKGTGVCQGDGGGGLTFVRNNNNKHYLIGILSVSPQDSGNCDENSYTLYTKVSSYIDFIASIYRSYRS